MAVSQTTRYPGTKSFLDEDLSRAVFCGREYEIAKLTNKIFANRLVVVYATSGAGKTSLLQAGISQLLRDENYLPLMVRKYDSKKTIIDSVYDGIRHVVDRAKFQHNTNFDPGSQLSLWHFFKIANFSQNALPLTPVLILDQFEEIFKQHNLDERSRFFAELGCLVRGIRPEHLSNSALGVSDDLDLTDQPPTARVAISLREDYFGALAEAYDYIPQIYHNIFRLLPLKQEDTRSAIVTPASIYRSGFDTKPFEFEPDAVERLLVLLGEKSKSGKIDPFQLQLQCQYIENWVKMKQDKGANNLVVKEADVPGKKAIREYYEDTIKNASEISRANKSAKDISLSIERIFISTRDRNSRESVRKDMLLSELDEGVLECLERQRLIRQEKYRDEGLYELTHDLWMQTIQEYNKQFETVDIKRIVKIFDDECKNWRDNGQDGDNLADRLLDQQLIEAYKFAESRRDLGKEEREFVSACNNAINRIIQEAALGRVNTRASQALNQKNNRRCRMLLAVEAFRIAEKSKIDDRSSVNKALWEAFQTLASYVPFPKGQCLREHSAPVSGVAIGCGNRRLVTADEDGTVLLWNLPELKLIDSQKLGHPVSAMAIATAYGNAANPDSDCLVIGCKDGSTYLFWNLDKSNLNERKELKRHRSAVKAVAFSRISGDDRKKPQWLITAGEDGTIYKWNLKDTLDYDHPFKDWRALENGIVSVAVSWDNDSLFIAGSQDKTKTVHRYDLTSCQETLTFPYNADIRVMVVARNNHWLVTGTGDGKVELRDLIKGDPQNSPPFDLDGHKGLACAAAISSPDDRWLVIGTDEGTVRLWDLHEMDKKDGNREPVHVWDDIKADIRTVEIKADNRWIVVGFVDGCVRLMDLLDPDAKPFLLHPSQGGIRAMTMSSDSKWLVTGSADGSVLIWDLMKPFIRYPIPLNISAGNVRSIVVGEKVPWLAIGSEDGNVRLWEIGSLGYGDLFPEAIPEPKHILSRHKANQNFNIMAFSRDGRWLVSCSNRVKRISAEEECTESWENSWTQSWDNPILWDMNASDPSQRSFALKGHNDLVRTAVFSRDSRWLVTAGDDKTARLWDLNEPDPSLNSMELSGKNGHEKSIWAVAISDNNKWLVAAGDDDEALLWELPPPSRAPDPKVRLKPRSWGMRAAAFSPNNKWLALGNYWDGYVRIWDTNNLDFSQPDPKQQSLAKYILTGHSPKLNFNIIAFSPDSRWLVTCGNLLIGDKDGNRVKDDSKFDQAFLWDMEDPAKRYFKLTGHNGVIRAAVFSSFSSKERWLVTVGDDKIARLWDLNASDPSSTAIELLGHKKAIWAAAITPDDHWLITGDDDGQVFLWSLRPKELIKLGKLIVGRNLTRDEAQRCLQNQREQATYNLPDDPYALASIKGWIDCLDED